MKVDIWSDVVCPWCYIGKRRFEQALRGFEHADAVTVAWHAFELDPSAPVVHGETDYVARLAGKYGMTYERAREMVDGMTATAKAAGLDFDFAIARAGNTFDAHRVLHLARRRGVQDAVKERFLRATFTEGRAIADRETLIELAVDAGLDGDEVAEVLRTDAGAREVRTDEAQARQLGITGVPFFVIDERYGVSGAQTPEVLTSALEQAWSERRRPSELRAEPSDQAVGTSEAPAG